jgi:hypothetical protein
MMKQKEPFSVIISMNLQGVVSPEAYNSFNADPSADNYQYFLSNNFVLAMEF